MTHVRGWLGPKITIARPLSFYNNNTAEIIQY